MCVFCSAESECIQSLYQECNKFVYVLCDSTLLLVGLLDFLMFLNFADVIVMQ